MKLQFKKKRMFKFHLLSSQDNKTITVPFVVIRDKLKTMNVFHIKEWSSDSFNNIVCTFDQVTDGSTKNHFINECTLIFFFSTIVKSWLLFVIVISLHQNILFATRLRLGFSLKHLFLLHLEVLWTVLLHVLVPFMFLWMWAAKK